MCHGRRLHGRGWHIRLWQIFALRVLHPQGCERLRCQRLDCHTKWPRRWDFGSLASRLQHHCTVTMHELIILRAQRPTGEGLDRRGFGLSLLWKKHYGIAGALFKEWKWFGRGTISMITVNGGSSRRLVSEANLLL